LKAKNATVIRPYGLDADTSASGRKQKLKRVGVPLTPAIIITKGGIAVLFGSAVVAESKNMGLQNTYWYEYKTGTNTSLH
jgi:hypothetical protein